LRSLNFNGLKGIFYFKIVPSFYFSNLITLRLK
jgi:hypothetical protein